MKDLRSCRGTGSRSLQRVLRQQLAWLAAPVAVPMQHLTRLLLLLLLCASAANQNTMLTVQIQFLADCDHPNVVRYLGSFRLPDALWIVMEHCGGGSVGDLLQVRGSLSPVEACLMCLEIHLLGAYSGSGCHLPQVSQCANFMSRGKCCGARAVWCWRGEAPGLSWKGWKS